MAKHLNLNVIRALALPGKTAPSSAAEFIMDTVTNILKESEV